MKKYELDYLKGYLKRGNDKEFYFINLLIFYNIYARLHFLLLNRPSNLNFDSNLKLN